MKEEGKISGTVTENVRRSKRLSLITAAFGVVFVLVVVTGVYLSFKGAVGILGNIGGNITNGIVNVFGENVASDAEGRTNILVIGVGGGDHDGPNLTDSIMVASLNRKNGSAAMLSIPRDLYVTVPKIGPTKINGVYDAALRMQSTNISSGVSPSDQEGAMAALRELAEEITGVEIQYYMKIDFQGFVEVVDLVGGVEVDVPENLIDRQYPNDTQSGYTTFALKKGLQTLDGKTALKYARSRHSTSDYARSERQQQLIKALLEKISSKGVLSDPTQLRRMYLSISSNVSTDLNWREILNIAGVVKDLDRDNIASAGLHDDPSRIGGLLYTPSREYFGGASVSIPNGATAANTNYYKDIQYFANMYFTYPDFFSTPPKVMVLNGTKENGRRVGGVAGGASALFAKFTDAKVEVANAPATLDLEATEAFYTTDDAKNHLEVISLFLPSRAIKGAPVDKVYSDELAAYLEEYDIVFVIGNDYKEYLFR